MPAVEPIFSSEHENYIANEGSRKTDIVPHFYNHPEDGKEHVSLTIPGDKYSQPDFIVEQKYIDMFPREYQAFLAKEDQLIGQTRFEDVPGMINYAQRSWLGKVGPALGVISVETLAAVSDSNIDNLGPAGHELRKKAKAYVAEKEKAAKFDGVNEQLQAQAKKIAELEKALATKSKAA